MTESNDPSKQNGRQEDDPSPEMLEIARKVTELCNEHNVTPEALLEQLKEQYKNKQ